MARRWLAAVTLTVAAFAPASIRRTAAALTAVGADRDAAFTIAVVRRDGILIPFATYDGRRWRTDWPQPREHVDVPINVRSVPSAWWGPVSQVGTWHVAVGSGPLRTVRVVQPDWFEAQCLRQVGLRTDYRPTEMPPGPDAQPYPKDGLAMSSPREVLHVDVLTPGDPPAPMLAQFNAQELSTIARIQAGGEWRHPLSRQQREATPLKVEAVYAAGPQNARVYYFETIRQYPSPPSAPAKSECVSVSYGAGWFVQNEADQAPVLRPLGFHVEVTGCRRSDLLYMLPLGAMNLSRRLFWFAQMSGWDYEEYDIVEIREKDADTALKVPGGRC